MLSVNVPRGATLERLNCGADGQIPDSAVWLDLYAPTPAEDRLVEKALAIALPTREEMQEIEFTSRLYVENGARYRCAAHNARDLHPFRPPSRHRALRRTQAV